MQKITCALVICVCVMSVCAKHTFAKSVVNVTFSVVNGPQRNSYQKVFDEFERLNPEYKVNLRFEASETYKEKIESWLQSDSHSDLMIWFGGARLNDFIEKGLIRAIDDLWEQQRWQQRYTASSQSAVKHEGRVYGTPLHYYHWAIYYRKSLFARFNLSPPKTWKEFLEVCSVLKKEGIVPIALGSKDYWPLAGWFDYLNLRLNGLSVHNRLVRGELKYQDPAIQNVFQTWKQLVDEQYFLEEHETLTWRDALPYLYRNLAGMVLMGNFWTSQIPDSMRSDFSLFRFPIINDESPLYEEAPTDVLFIPKNVRNIEGAKRLLTHIASPSVLNNLNNELGMLAPQLQAQPVDDPFLNLGLEILSSAEGASQFYDRDNPKPIATEGMKMMREFMMSPERIDRVTRGLDLLRKQSFSATSN